MKRRSQSALFALSLLFLAACGQKQAAGDHADATEPPQSQPTELTEQVESTAQTGETELTEQTGPAAVQDYSTAEALRRPEHAWLHFYPETVPDEDGAEEMSPDRTEMLKAESTLYIGDGYPIYIFDEGWVYQSDTMGGYHTDIWKGSFDGGEAELRIVILDTDDYDEARTWIKKQYPDYILDENKSGGIDGIDLPFPNDTIQLYSGVPKLGDSVYAVIWTQQVRGKHYDHFMYQMRAMRETIRPVFYFPTAGELGRPEHVS